MTNPHLPAARIRQRGAGFVSPLLTVTEEQLARADADIASWKDRAKCADGFRLTAYGLEKV